jgi:hypothetical protein
MVKRKILLDKIERALYQRRFARSAPLGGAEPKGWRTLERRAAISRPYVQPPLIGAWIGQDKPCTAPNNKAIGDPTIEG